MDRNSLYVLILILGAALGVAFVSKKGGIEKMFSPDTKQQDSWMKDDPGWDTMPQPKFVEPTPPPTPPAPQPPAPKVEPKTQPQQRMQPINRPPLNCPPNG